MKKSNKWLTLSALLFGGGTLLQGCLGDFVDGAFNTGWPSGNLWLNIGIDVLKEELFG